MHEHPVGDEVRVEVFDIEVVDGDRPVQLLQPQARYNPRVAGDGLDAVSASACSSGTASAAFWAFWAF